MRSRHADTPIKAIRIFGLSCDMLVMTALEYMACTSTEADPPARDHRPLYHINGLPEARYLARSCLHADGSHSMGRQGQVGMFRDGSEHTVSQSTDVV